MSSDSQSHPESELRNNRNTSNMVEGICGHFGDDIDQSALIRQLGCLQDVQMSQTPQAMSEPFGELPLPATITTIVTCLRKLGPHIAMFSEVKVIGAFPVTASHFSSGREKLQWFKASQDVSADSYVTGAPQQLGHTSRSQTIDT